MMQTTPISGLPIAPSRIGLGTWAIGGWLWGGTDERAAVRTLSHALERGINLIDTAPVYGFGRSEEIVGRVLADEGARDRVVLATKAGLDWRNEKPFRNASRARILKEIDDSLRRLRTDVIDIYFVHWPDDVTPVEETAEAMRTLLDAGKIRAVGVSNFSVPQMEAFRRHAPLHVAQPPYNVFERGIEADILPYCQEHAIATLNYGALCRGLLSGKMNPDQRFGEGDLRSFDPKFQPPRFAQYLAAVERLDALARERFQRDVIHLAVRWVLDRPGASVALWGARKPEQLDPAADAMSFTLDEEAMAAVDAILGECVPDPVGPEFMAPPTREQAGG
jgi:aryl-alcohol dehydrogenase-like predicted oxidoreductase